MDPSSSSSSSLARARARASSSSRASRSRAHLDDDERSPELIERETHRARPIVANSRRRASHPRAPVDVGVEDPPAVVCVCVFHRRWTDDCTERRVVHDRETKERRRGGPSPPYCNTVKRRVRRAKSDGRLWTWCMRAGGGWMWSRDPSNRHPCRPHPRGGVDEES